MSPSYIREMQAMASLACMQVSPYVQGEVEKFNDSLQEKNTRDSTKLSLCRHSGTETNLKVGGTGLAQKWGEYRLGTLRRKNFFSSCPSTFWALKVQIVVLVSAFVMVSTVWSVSCLLFFY